MNQTPDLNKLSPEQLKVLTAQLLGKQQQLLDENKKLHDETTQLLGENKRLQEDKARYAFINEKLTHELAILKRHRFAKTSEVLSSGQRQLFEELLTEDIVAIENELAELAPSETTSKPKQRPKRKPLPPELPRTVIEHEPDNTSCSCGCQMQRIGEDISEKLDYTPGEFTVERHVRGKWVCRDCDIMTQAPVPAQVIDKGMATSGLLAHTLIAKYCDHLPLYRQEKIFARAGVPIPRSTLAEWVGKCGVQLQPMVDRLQELVLEQSIIHGDETPVALYRISSQKAYQGDGPHCVKPSL